MRKFFENSVSPSGNDCTELAYDWLYKPFVGVYMCQFFTSFSSRLARFYCVFAPRCMYLCVIIIKVEPNSFANENFLVPVA